MTHVHIERDATDCDGRITRTWVQTCGDTDADDTHEQAWLAIQPPYWGDPDTSPHDGHAYVSVRGGRITYVASWSTEEGGVAIEATPCFRDCSDAEPTYRDHRAEEAGY